MSFPRYPRYKDSGVEWLGEVPEHWTAMALKRGFEVTLGKMLQPERVGVNDELLPYLRAANIQWEGIDSTDVKQMWFNMGERERLALRGGDLLVSEGGDVGRSCIYPADLVNHYFQNSINRVRGKGPHSTQFLYYWMVTIKAKGYVDVLCNKSTIAHFTAEKVASLPVPMPTPSEQKKIAAFLDVEIAKIDGLITEQRLLINRLQEKRQAVIFHTITKGLDPDTPTKRPSAEWPNDVPAHWEVTTIKRFSTLQRGYDLTDTQRTDGPYPVVTSGGITGTHGSYMAKGPGVITGRYGSTGRLFYVETDFWPHNTSLFVSDFHGNMPRFVWFALQAIDFSAYSEKSAVPGIDRNDLHRLLIAVPPPEEQNLIVDALEAELSDLDALALQANKAVALLQERRTALISAAVTGKIDVRGLAEAA